MAETVATTERLTLRTWDRADRVLFLAHLNTPAVMRWLGAVQDEATANAALDRIDGFERDYGHTFWLVERRADHELLGFCGIKRVNAEGTALTGQHEIGWRLREDAWGQGFAHEAATASLDLAFGGLGAPHVVAFTVAGNVASWRLMERLGMTRSGDLDFDDPRYSGDLNPTIVYRITAEEWLRSRSAR
ncbi:MAG: GNAT family N-acetyltransferase [Sphingomicrobium sp.]